MSIAHTSPPHLDEPEPDDGGDSALYDAEMRAEDEERGGEDDGRYSDPGCLGDEDTDPGGADDGGDIPW